jgi:hypothetical protein
VVELRARRDAPADVPSPEPARPTEHAPAISER